MILYTQSNRLEELADALVDDIDGARGGDPFQTAVVLVPNQAVAAWIELRMAARAGIAANLRFPFLESYLAGRARARAAAGAPERILERAALEALLCGALADAELLADPDLGPVRAYLSAADAGAAAETHDALELRRFQLAREVAGLFVDYAMARPELAAAWPERTLHAGGPFAATEAWQRRLWLAIFGPDGALARLGDEQRWLLLPAYFEVVPGAELELARPLHLFGFPAQAPAWYRIFERLGAATDLHLYALNPCREFWEDARRGDTTEQAALRLWGRAGREQARRLAELSGLVEQGDRDRWIDPGTDTALARLQHDALVRRDDAAAAADPRPPLPRDDSVRLLACPGVRRELEVIGTEIWRLLRADPTLRTDDIAVLFPRGEAERYQAQVAAVFGELGDLPHHLLDAPLAGPGRVLEAFDHLLDLPFGRFTRPELLRLLTHPAVIARFPDLDPGDWVRWAVRLGIVHGGDRADHQGTYIKENVFHWDQGIQRLALGAVMTGERSGALLPFTIGGGTWLPEEVGQDDLASAGRFALLARSLIADARHLRELRLPLAQWATMLDLLVTTYLVPATDEDERHLGRCRQAAASLRDRDLDGRAVGYRTACEMVRAEIADLRGPRGEPLAGGILVAPLAHGRALPFRVIFVAGLGEGRFPANERNSPLDLSSLPPPAGGGPGWGAATLLGPRDRDRGLFLETMLAARDRLYLSWVARDEQSGEELEPSSVVLELERMVLAELDPAAAAALRVRHPLRRFDPKYYPALFPAPAVTADVDSAAPVPAIESGDDPPGAQQARALALRHHLEDHFRSHGQPPPGPDRLHAITEDDAWATLAARLELTRGPAAPRAIEPRLVLPIADLRRFLECPMQTWARRVLGLREDDPTDLVADDVEPFEVSRLDETALLRELFADHLLAGEDWARLEQRYRRASEQRRLGGRAPVGPFDERVQEHERRLLTRWRAELAASGALDGPWQVRCFGRAPEQQQVRRLEPPIGLTIDVAGQAVAVELVGKTEPMNASAGSVTLMAGKAGDRHRLRGFFDHLVVAAAGDPPPGRAALIAGSGASQRLRLAPVSAADARAYLGALATELLGSRHAYLLPIEVVLTCLEDPERSPAQEARKRVRNERAWFSSRGGPVDRIEEIDPLPDPEARAVIERRFGLFARTVEVERG